MELTEAETKHLGNTMIHKYAYYQNIRDLYNNKSLAGVKRVGMFNNTAIVAAVVSGHDFTHAVTHIRQSTAWLTLTSHYAVKSVKSHILRKNFTLSENIIPIFMAEMHILIKKFA